MAEWWEGAPPHLFFGPADNGQEASWGGKPPPPAERLIELRFPHADEDALRALIGSPSHDALGRRRAIAVFGIEHAKTGARRLLRPLIDGGAFVAIFTHAPQCLSPGVLSRCATVRTPAATSVVDSLATLRLRDDDASRSCVAMSAGPARRTALTALFQSGVTLTEFLRAATSTANAMTYARRARLAEAAARAEHAALGSINAIVHAEEFLTHADMRS